MEGTVTFVMERKKAFAPFGKAEDVFINGVKFASLKAGASATAQVPREEVYLVEGLTIFDGSTLYPDCGDGTYHLFMETPPRSAPLFTLTYEGQPVEGKNPYEDALKAIDGVIRVREL